MYKTILFIALTSFTLIALWGMYMPMGEQGGMAPCPLMGSDATLCMMDIAEHIATWRAFLSVPLTQGLGMVMLMAALSAFWVAGLYRSRAYVVVRYKALVPQRVYAWQVAEIRITHTLVQAFSDGILHPKTF